MLVGAGETPVNKTYKCPAIMEFTFWHWAISKEAKRKKALWRNNKAGHRE